MSLGARIFVAVVFLCLGASFIATTAALIGEFQTTEWIAIALVYSQLFIFFPTFGLVALAAFYLPAACFVDLYWKHVPLGKLRFLIGTVVVAGAAYYVSSLIVKGDIPAIWELKPDVLRADQGDPSGCDAQSGGCDRVGVLPALSGLRQVSQSRIGITKFVRDCKPDPLVEPSPDLLQKRYCFVTQSLLPAAACCQAQERFSLALAGMYKDPFQRSSTQRVHKLLLPSKVFFLLVLLVVGILLALWRKSVDRHYAEWVPRLERCILIGAFAMLFWPVANHAFLQSVSLLYGPYGGSFYQSLAPVFSIVFGAWALLLLFFFFRGFEKDIEATAKIVGAIASIIAILKYEELIDLAVRFAGSGADSITLAALAIVAVLAFAYLFGQVGKYRADRLASRASQDEASKGIRLNLKQAPMADSETQNENT